MSCNQWPLHPQECIQIYPCTSIKTGLVRYSLGFRGISPINMAFLRVILFVLCYGNTNINTQVPNSIIHYKQIKRSAILFLIFVFIYENFCCFIFGRDLALLWYSLLLLLKCTNIVLYSTSLHFLALLHWCYFHGCVSLSLKTSSTNSHALGGAVSFYIVFLPIYNNKFNSYKFHIYFFLFFFPMLFVLFPGSISPARLSSISFSSVSVASNIFFKSLNAFSNSIESLLAFCSIAVEDATNVIITIFVVGVHL